MKMDIHSNHGLSKINFLIVKHTEITYQCWCTRVYKPTMKIQWLMMLCTAVRAGLENSDVGQIKQLQSTADKHMQNISKPVWCTLNRMFSVVQNMVYNP